ncbi:MAG: hypothetical protein WCA19_17580 [Candidatus Acidiferrales bacterium]
MNSLIGFFLRPQQGPTSTVLIRLAVGLIFSTQGILKYIDPNMGVIRFTKIGFPHPYFTAHFVGTGVDVLAPAVGKRHAEKHGPREN